MPFTSCNYRWQAGIQLSLYFLTPCFIIISFSFISFIYFFLFYTANVFFILWYYCFPENILLRTHLHRTSSDIPICAFVLDCQSSEVSFFFLNLSFVTFFISNCWYLPHLIQRCYVAQLLFCTEQVRSIHLFCSSKNRHVGKKKWKLRQTSDDRTEKSVEYMCDRSCIVLRLTTVVWTEMSEYRCIYGKKKTIPLDTFLCFIVSIILFFCCCWKENSIYLLLLKNIYI